MQFDFPSAVAVVVGLVVTVFFFIWSKGPQHESSSRLDPEEIKRLRLERFANEVKGDARVPGRSEKSSSTEREDKRHLKEKNETMRKSTTSITVDVARPSKGVSRLLNSTNQTKASVTHEVASTGTNSPNASTVSFNKLPPDKMELEGLNLEASKKTSPQSKKQTPRSRKTPTQVLCRALSDVTGQTVANSNSGGRDVILLPLDTAANYTELTFMLQSNLEKFKYSSTKQAVQWHSRIHTVVRDIALITDEDRSLLKKCMDVFADFVISSVAAQLHADIMVGFVQDDNDDDLALFSDDYNPTGSEPSDNVIDAKGSADEFLDLLKPVDTIVSKQFMCDLMVAYEYHRRCAPDAPELASLLLKRALDRMPSIDRCQHAFTSQQLCDSLTMVSNLTVLSPEVAKELLHTLDEEARNALPTDSERTARDFQSNSVLSRMLAIAALSVPDAGDEMAVSTQSRRLSHFQLSLRSLGNYPLCAFSKERSDTTAVNSSLADGRRTMLAAREACTAILRRVMKAGTKEDFGMKQVFFRWLAAVVRSNEEIATVLASDLLKPTGAQQHCASRKFRAGISAVAVNFCVESLYKRFEEKGLEAFDSMLLVESGEGYGPIVLPGERRLFSAFKGSLPEAPESHTGSTHFFFLTAALLRIGLFPCLRAQEALYEEHASIFARMTELVKTAQDNNGGSLRLSEQEKVSSDAVMGWTAFLKDSAFVKVVTKFSMLQLHWLNSVAESSSAAAIFSIVPEWFCKLPAEWVAFVATQAPSSLSLTEGEAAVECSTRILQLVNETRKQGCLFTPPVITELIRIPGAFVRSGVNRARWRAKVALDRKSSRRPGTSHEVEQAIDDRDLDIYSSFDRNDLGVTAFTNKYVLKHLGPTLISTFSSLDAVEGADVEREHHFDKFQVKSEVAELILRLWCHPSCEAKDSIVACEASELSRFVSSLAAAVGLVLDNALHRLTDVRDVLFKRRQPLAPLTRLEKHNIEFLSRHLVSGLSSARRLLLVLFHLSGEDAVATLLGGTPITVSSVTLDLSNMVLNFLNRLTNEGGGTNPDIDFRLSIVRRSVPLTKEEETEDLLRARRRVWNDYGLDVSVFVHEFLALAAKWHSVAKQSTGARDSTSELADQMAKNEDYNVDHLRSVFRRLVVCPLSDDQRSMLESDGHVDFSLWSNVYETKTDPLDGINGGSRSTAAQDQITHKDILQLATVEEIHQLLVDVEAAAKKLGQNRLLLSESKLHDSELAIVNCNNCTNTEAYCDWIGNYLVNSESFQCKSGCFTHFHDLLARQRGLSSSAKTLTKEARKCQKLLPSPNPDAAIFTCFAEERMDLCRAIITGMADTPYSLGLFEFDIFFPSTFPSAPPLVNFMTTGGGQVRFNPNLYNDGKVCISLLGTARSWTEAQRWNTEDSSLAQILLSIQTQILGVKDPYFNEGFGHEGMRQTEAGREGSIRYNTSLRLATLRHAIIAQIKHPPRGFEDVVIRHFSLCRKRLLVQARCWMLEAQGSSSQKRFESAYNELVGLLSSDLFRAFKGYNDVVPPSENDMRSLHLLDEDFAQTIVGDTHGDDDALQVDSDNPWANPSLHVSQSLTQGNTHRSSEAGEGDEDDLYT